VTDVVLAVDQGTSSTRCFVVDTALDIVAEASRPVGSSFPRPGWVEQDPREIADSVTDTIAQAVDDAGVEWNEVKGIGIDNQTETFVVWDRQSGEPIYPAIVWQDRRTAAQCDRLRDAGHEPTIRALTGLEVDPSFSATKLARVLEEVDGAREAAEAGHLAFGDVASWVIWKLSDGRTHVTEPSNASRSMLMDLHRLAWHDDLLELFGVPRAMLPEIRPSGSVLAETAPAILGAAVPVAGALGDQQAALFGQQCWESGMAKLTLGTGAFVWANAGTKPPTPPPGILGTCGWQLEGETAFALEGFVPVAGAAVSWLVEVGVLDAPDASEALVEGAGPDDDVWFVPALTGLGAPSWDADARGVVVGLTRGVSRGQLVRAALDGVVHQVADAVEAMDAGAASPLERLRVDGGMAENDWLLQRLADVLGRPVERPVTTEATGIGAASVAGLTVGLWSGRDELRDRWRLDRRFDPSADEEDRRRRRARWREALAVATGWS
jgi:glycerol kinase